MRPTYDAAMTTPSARAVDQYASTTGNLSARIAIYDHRTNPQDWYSWLGERLPLTGDVLEVGAGTGALWRRLDHRSRGVRLTLADFSPAMCARLQTVPGATVMRCDATALPLADASFDTVIANHMLYHLDDPADGLREFARVLRPGGRLAVTVNGRGHLAEIAEVGPAAGRPDLQLARMNNDFAADTAEAYLGRFFHGIELARYPSGLAIPDASPILTYLGSLGQAPLTADERSRVRDFVNARIASDGAFLVQQHAVLVTASR